MGTLPLGTLTRDFLLGNFTLEFSVWELLLGASRLTSEAGGLALDAGGSRETWLRNL